MAKKGWKVFIAPISERAVLARINRKLKPDNKQLKKCKADSQGYGELGDYYEVDLNLNAVTATHVDLQQRGTEMKVLADFEQIHPITKWFKG